MPSSYTIIDNIPQNKKPNNMNVVMINQLIEGFDTVQNTLENIDNTNKYNVELNYYYLYYYYCYYYYYYDYYYHHQQQRGQRYW